MPATDVTYISKVLRQLHDVYVHGLQTPDGFYPVLIDGTLDLVLVRDGLLDCANFGPIQIRGTHPHVFRSGEWATLADICWDADSARRVYMVVFPDSGVTDTRGEPLPRLDTWPVADHALYEFRQPIAMADAYRTEVVAASLDRIARFADSVNVTINPMDMEDQ